MTNRTNAKPPGTGGSEAKAVAASLATHGRSSSHESPAILSQQASQSPEGDNESVTSHRTRKRDRFLKYFRSSKSEEQVKSDLEPGPQSMTETRKARSDIFSENVSRPATSIELPKVGTRINSTAQLALCGTLISKGQGVQGQAEGASQDIHTDQKHLDWIKAVQSDIVEQDHIRWLGTRMVEEFSKDAVKDSAAITEVVLLGPVLDREHYRKLLNCFIFEFG
ncbi:hypothetical protein BGZ72_010431, partial [Mortierella alpina]